jgi:hypothetical protein
MGSTQGRKVGRQTAPSGVRVSVELDWNVLEPSIAIHLSETAGSPFSKDLGDWDFLSWERGAIYGVKFALDQAIALPCAVRITEMTGQLGETNPTIVAAAAATATWGALEYEPSLEVQARLQAAVVASWGQSASHVESFD